MRFAVLLSILVAACAGAGSEPAPAATEDSFIDLLARTNAKVEQFQFSPDGSRIAYVSSKNGSADIWVMNADGTGARAITDAYPEAESDPQWSPDGEWIAFVTRHCGTGCWTDIFMTRADGSIPPIDLSYGRGGPMPRWSADGKSIFFQSISEDGYYHIATLAAEIPMKLPEIRTLTSGPDNYADPQISPDGEWLAFASTRTERARGQRMSGVWLMPLSGGAPRLLVEGGDAPRWSPDGAKIAFVAIVEGWRNIGVVDVESGRATMLTDDAWDSANPQWSPDNRWIAYVANREWNFSLMKISPEGGQSQQLTERAGVNGGFEGTNVRGTFRWSPDGQSIVYTFMDHARTSDLWTIPAEGGTPRPLTNHMPESLTEDRFVAPELVRYPSAGRQIPAFLYKPRNIDASTRAPLLLYSHSFGSGMHVNGFYPFVQYFVSKGYVVLSPQVRGSAGLGREFERANDGDWGGGDIDDTAAAVDYLDGLGLIDRNRVVMQGGSTGGYRVMQTAVRYPDLLAAGVNLYGPTNLVSLYDFYLPSRKPILMRVVGGERGDPSMASGHWRERSATFNIERVETPLMLYWADRDRGVPTAQADEFLHLARERGHTVEYVVTDNESHGWYTWRPETLRESLERIEAFYEQHIGE